MRVYFQSCEGDAMKAMLKSATPEGIAATHGRQSAQRRDTGPDLHGQSAQTPPTGASALAAAPRIVAQRKQLQDAFGPAIQRAGIEDEEPLQGKLLAVQRQELEDEPMQGKFAPVQRAAEESSDSQPANRTGMPDHLKAGVESLSGLSLDHVRVHYHSDEPAQLNALAYAQGSDIHVAPGQEQHLPHEAWHVVQQAQGRVQPTMQLNEGVPVNDDAGLEQEADVMGTRALNIDPFESSRRSR